MELVKGFWKENPILVTILGLCPTLAVTASAVNALTMGLAVVFVLIASSTIVSLIRSLVPKQARIASFIVIIATLVTMVDLFLKAYFLPLSRTLGPYVPLIVVNCIILGRAESFASKNKVGLSILDALGIFLPLITTNCAILGLALFRASRGYGFIENVVFGIGAGMGFTLALTIMAGIREQLEFADVPQALKGPAITRIIAGLLALAFMGFAGLISSS